MTTEDGVPLPGAPDPWVGSSMPELRAQPPYLMTEMIEAEPGHAARTLARLGAAGSSAARLAALVRDAAESDRIVLVTGCGTSEHAAQATAEILAEALDTAGLLASHPGSRPLAVQALEATLDGSIRRPGALVIGVSHEGGTSATNAALRAARDAGATTALVTVSDRSPGAALVDVVVATLEQDRSWCHTLGYLSPMLAATAVAAHLTGVPIAPESARELLAAGLSAAAVRAAEGIAAALAGLERIVVVGSGVDRPAARELVLKLEEGTHVPAVMRELETMLHGHLAGMDPRTGVVLVLTDERTAAARAARATGVLSAVGEIGAPAAAIVGSAHADAVPPSATPAGRIAIPSAPGLPSAARSLLGSAVPLQLITERLARRLGVNPDPIRRDDAAYLRAAAATEGSI